MVNEQVPEPPAPDRTAFAWEGGAVFFRLGAPVWLLWGKHHASGGITVLPHGGCAGDLSDVVGVRYRNHWGEFCLRSAVNISRTSLLSQFVVVSRRIDSGSEVLWGTCCTAM